LGGATLQPGAALGFGCVDQGTPRNLDGSHLALPFQVGVPDIFEGRHRVPSG